MTAVTAPPAHAQPPQAADGPIIVIGGGHASAQVCVALATAGLGRQVLLVSDETHLPYQRPPLSKAYLKNPDEAVQLHRSEAWFADAGITVHRGDAAVAIDRTARTVRLASGTVLGWQRLVLATGASARSLPGLPNTPAALTNVTVLRSADDAQRLRGLLAGARSLTVLGGGFIGLEIAATAKGLGLAVQVLEGAPRLLQRSVSPEVSAHVLATHLAAGIDVRLSAKVSDPQVQGGRLASLVVDGQVQPVDLLVVGIGSTPHTALAEACGLACQDGVLVDSLMRTSDASILAVGDCTRFMPVGGSNTLRLESVQNANDQARTAAATLQGQVLPYTALPWFWSEQGSLRLQMAGLMPADGQRHRRPGANEQSFSLLHYVPGANGPRLTCIESVNAPMDHMMSRKLLEAGKNPAPEAACDPAVPLKNWL